MNSEYMREFIVAAESASLTEAAKRLFIDQSTLVRHLAAFEVELGVSLFTRSHGVLSLTPAGKTCYQKTSRMLSDYEGLKVSVRQEEEVECVTIEGNAYSSGMRSWVLRAVLSAFREELPVDTACFTHRFSWEGGDLGLLQSLLDGGDIDFAIVQAPTTSFLFEKYAYIDMFQEGLSAIVANDNPFARRENLGMAELLTQRVATFSFYPQWSECVLEACAQVGSRAPVECRTRILTDPFALEQCLESLAANEVAFVSSSLTWPHMDSSQSRAKVVSLKEGDQPFVRVRMVYRKNGCTRGVRLFSEFARRAFEVHSDRGDGGGCRAD